MNPKNHRQTSVRSRFVWLTLSQAIALTPFVSWAGVDIAQQPLFVAEPVPPNILLIIDDSGSMDDSSMCAPGITSCSSGVNSLTSTRNTLAYNPSVTYEPWYDSSGNPMANANRAAVSNNNIRITGTTINLTSSNQTFYFPRNSTTGDNGTNGSLYLWRLNTDGTTARRCSVGQTGNCGDVFTSFTWNRADGTTVTRTMAQEWQNYANWYHYYRGRMKMAKASVSRAFAGLGSNFRVGYNTINNNNTFNIPVSNDNGLFRGSNKSTFYDRLFATNAPGMTPLRAALDRAGQYFSSNAADGPYGPESGTAQLSCRQNFAILTTDGAWNDAQAATAAARLNVDGTSSTTPITNPKTNQSYTYQAVSPYTDTRTNTLADVAMYYWKNDLRTDLENNVPISSNNPAFWQHMRTFGISIGLRGNVEPTGPYPSNWADPTNTLTKIDDLLHASLNSRGQFIVASNPEEFTQSLRSSLDAITNETKASASGGASSALIEAGAKTFFSQYTSGTWNGTIRSHPIDEITGLQNTAASAWPDAPLGAESKLPAWAQRNIYVNANGTAVAFRYSNLTSTQQSALGSVEVVDYLRGERINEQPSGALRGRAGVLPAFINSQLAYVGAPIQASYYANASFSGASEYADYAESKKTRTPVIYIAGNNGMLHAFNANTGAEIYAFLPNISIMHPTASATNKTLKLYADPKYGLNDSADADWETYKHRYILDGELTVADVYLAGAWKTILVGTQGRGGKGVFAIDVTDPTDIKFLWEKSASDSGALGNNLGKPVIAQVASGDWRVVLGNGPNSTGDKAQLVMIKVADGSISTVDTEVADDNGLAGVNLWDADKDGFFETAYAGDLKGNLWRFKNLGGSPTVAKLFATHNARPITAMPLVVRNQKTDQTWVFVGTGQNLNTTDQTNMNLQTWYGLIDSGSLVSTAALKERQILGSGTDARTLEAGTEAEIINHAVNNRGWFINFAANGERMITPNTLLGGALFGTTYTPDGSNRCSPDGKSSLWAINPFSGARLSQGIFDINNDGVINNLDKVGNVFPSILDGLSPITSGQPPITVGKDGKFTLHQPDKSIAGALPVGLLGRQSWREIIGQ